MASHHTRSPPIKSVDTAFRIVETVKEEDGVRVGELATLLNLPESTVSDYLVTLRTNQYLVKEGNTYRIGLRFLELGDHARNFRNIYQSAKRKIDSLATKTGDLVHLSVEENGLGVIIYEREGVQAVSLDTYVGRRVHLHSTALGKAMLAYMPDAKVEEIIDRFGLPLATSETITDETELYAELATIRDRGYAISNGERIEGLGCIAVPIRDTSEQTVLGAVSVCEPTSKLENNEFQEKIPRQVKEEVNRIELDIRYS